MRSLTLAAGVATLALPLSAAQSAVFTLGGPLSKLCYEAAAARDDRQSALDSCTRSLDEEGLLKPDRAATYVNRGILHMVRGDDADADADFNEAANLEPALPDPWLNQAFIRLRAGHGSEALPLLQEGIKRNPERRALAIFARGVAYEQMGRFDSAYSDLKRAHELEPGWALPSKYLSRYRLVSR
jgi:tetratricopeptide (TPR) repeat protein